MRMLMTVTIPHQTFNAAMKDGSAMAKIKRILEANKAEQAYFTERHGHRAAVLVVDVAEPSQIPALAEPWFLAFDADVELDIAMTPADLERSRLDQCSQKWS